MNKNTNKMFQGILQYTSEQFENVEKKKGYIYLVRESGEVNEGDAEVWFGNRRYGTTNVSELSSRNVGAIDTGVSMEDVGGVEIAKMLIAEYQYLTFNEQEQVRSNINAMKDGDISCGTF